MFILISHFRCKLNTLNIKINKLREIKEMLRRLFTLTLVNIAYIKPIG